MDKHLDPEAIGDYAEGLMDRSQRAAADAHLAGCAQCRQGLAAAQAYFRELGGLEPISAPADFLAKVRARLPRSVSPWRRLWSDLSAAIRAVPMPIAVAAILGVTAITVYLKQEGSDVRPAAPAPLSSVASKTAPSPGTFSETTAPKAPPAALEAPPPPAVSAPRPPGEAPLRLTAPGSSVGSPNLAKLNSGRAPGSFRIAGRRSPALQDFALNQKPEPRPAPAASPGGIAGNGPVAAPASADQEANRNPAGEAMGEAAGAAPALSEAYSVPAAPRAKASADDRDAAALPTGYVLSLRNAGDSGAVLSGLKAMGIRCEPAPGRTGERRFLLTVPAPMLGELVPYLSRYGTAVLHDAPPSSAGDSVAVRLRLRLPIP